MDRYSRTTGTTVFAAYSETTVETDETLSFLKNINEKLVSEDEVILTRYQKAKYVSQGNGARCGFATVAMAGTISGLDLNINDMVAWGIHADCTDTGGLFEVESLQRVCRAWLNVSTKIMSMPKATDMFSDLMRGKCFFVPYDAGEGGRPCCRQGAYAHWALVYGAVLPIPKDMTCSSVTRTLSSCPQIYSLKAGLPGGLHKDWIERGRLIAMHGWSQGPVAWKHADLKKSCNQLRHDYLEGRVLRLELPN